MHNIVDEWLDTLPEDVTPNSQLQIKGEGQAQEVLLGGKTKRVAAEAGDLVICKPPQDFVSSSKRQTLFARRATEHFCARREHAAAAFRGFQHRIGAARSSVHHHEPGLAALRRGHRGQPSLVVGASGWCECSHGRLGL